MRVLRLELDSGDLSVSLVVDRRRRDQLFALRCGLCRKLSLGCEDHWFCGLCEPCRKSVEDEWAELEKEGA